MSKKRRPVRDPGQRLGEPLPRDLAPASRGPSPVQKALDMIDWTVMQRQGFEPMVMTPEIVESIYLAIRSGAFRSTAARWAGVHPNTMGNWVRQGQSGNEPYAGFVRGLAYVEAASELAATQRLSSHRDFRAIVAFLERRYSARWGIKQREAPNGDAPDLAVLLVQANGHEPPRVITNGTAPAIPSDPRAALPSAKPTRTRVPEEALQDPPPDTES